LGGWCVRERALLASGEHSTGAVEREVGIWEAAASIPAHDNVTLAELERRRKDLRQERNNISKDIRNAETRRDRMMERASKLSDGDLLAVMAKRARAKAKAKAKALGKGQGKDRA
jgi:hypothetical protein